MYKKSSNDCYIPKNAEDNDETVDGNKAIVEGGLKPLKMDFLDF